jgi:hypothetical protein
MSLLRQLSVLSLSLLLLASCNEKSDSATSTPPASSTPCLDILNKQLSATTYAAGLYNAGETSINQWMIAYATPDHSQLQQIMTNIENSLGLGSVAGGVAFGYGIDSLEICSSSVVNSDKISSLSEKVAAKKAKAKTLSAAAPTDACTTLVGNLSSKSTAVTASLNTLESSLKNAISVASDPAKVKAAAEAVFIDSTLLMEKLGSLADFVDANKPALKTCSTASAAKAAK